MKIMFSVFPANKSEKKKIVGSFPALFCHITTGLGSQGEKMTISTRLKERVSQQHTSGYWLLLMVLIGRLLRPAGWVLGSFIILPRVQHGLHKTSLITIKDLICMHISCHLISTQRLLFYYCLKFNHYSVHWLQEFYCSNKSH